MLGSILNYLGSILNYLGSLLNKSVFTYTFMIGVAICLIAVLSGARSYHLPDNQQDYQPDQPIAFSHHLHSGKLSIDCKYCHTGAETSRHAGFPSASICMNCHSEVSTSWGAVLEEDKRIEALKEKAKKDGRELSPQQLERQELPPAEEIQKLYDYLALNRDRKPDPNKTPRPIEWVKVHNLPDYVYFDHRAHVHVGIDCQTCHGNVESMDRVRQVKSLSMGWCVNCHREANRIGVKGKTVHASQDCTTCHY